MSPHRRGLAFNLFSEANVPYRDDGLTVFASVATPDACALPGGGVRVVV